MGARLAVNTKALGRPDSFVFPFPSHFSNRANANEKEVLMSLRLARVPHSSTPSAVPRQIASIIS
jgi:hypothetical protein